MTEGLAACLEAACPDCAVTLIERVFEDVTVPSGPVEVWVQRPVTKYGRPDLVLHFGQGSSVLRVQFEVKVDAVARRDQGEKYMDWQRSQGGDWRFAWLLRVGADVPDGPAGAGVCTWQDVASAFTAWLNSQEERDRPGPWLVEQYVRHLEEQGLGQAQGLTSEDVAALDRRVHAQGMAKELIRQARERIDREWGLLPNEQVVSRNPVNFWHHVQKRSDAGRPTWPERSWFQWQCWRDHARDPDERRNEIAFAAGVVIQAGHHPLPGRTPDQEWLERRFEEGFEYANHGPGDKFFRLMRWLPLRDVAQVEDPGKQVDLVVHHALESLHMLAADPLTDEMCRPDADADEIADDAESATDDDKEIADDEESPADDQV